MATYTANNAWAARQVVSLGTVPVTAITIRRGDQVCICLYCLNSLLTSASNFFPELSSIGAKSQPLTEEDCYNNTIVMGLSINQELINALRVLISALRSSLASTASKPLFWWFLVLNAAVVEPLRVSTSFVCLHTARQHFWLRICDFGSTGSFFLASALGTVSWRSPCLLLLTIWPKYSSFRFLTVLPLVALRFSSFAVERWYCGPFGASQVVRQSPQGKPRQVFYISLVIGDWCGDNKEPLSPWEQTTL